MKKFIFIFVTASALFTACGPTAEEIAAQEKAVEDSLLLVKEAEAAIQQAIDDSTAKAQAEAELQMAAEDSLSKDANKDAAK